MMALALKKKKEEEEGASRAAAAGSQVKEEVTTPNATAKTPESSTPHAPSDEENVRGRRIDKGKAPVRVIGFDGEQQEGAEDEEYGFHACSPRYQLISFSVSFQWTGEP
jgi:GATA-binding protein